MNEFSFDQKSLIPLGIAMQLLLAAGTASAQQVALSVGSGSVAPGTSITVPITMTTSGSPQPAGLQWTMVYSPTDISSVTVTSGPVATAASKSVNCFSSSSTTTNCVAYGLNTNIMNSGTLASATFTIASGTPDASTAIQMSGVMATDATGSVNTISASGSGASLSIPQAGPPTLLSLSSAPTTLTLGTNSAWTVTRRGPAQSGGSVVVLSSNNPSVTVPSSVTVATGSASATFAATVSASTPASQTAVLTAAAASV